MNRSEIISYAMDFASYLLLKVDGIDRILLFGSVPRGDFDDASDVDIFVDTKIKNIQKRIDKNTEDYYQTRKFKEWQMKGIEKDFAVISGDLESDEWKDLKRAILSNGLLLYGRFTGNTDNLRQFSLFSFENIKPEKKRVALFRALFGFIAGKKRYDGLIIRIGGKRISKGSMIIPAQKSRELIEYFHKKKINFKVYDIWTDEKL